MDRSDGCVHGFSPLGTGRAGCAFRQCCPGNTDRQPRRPLHVTALRSLPLPDAPAHVSVASTGPPMTDRCPHRDSGNAMGSARIARGSRGCSPRQAHPEHEQAMGRHIRLRVSGWARCPRRCSFETPRPQLSGKSAPHETITLRPRQAGDVRPSAPASPSGSRTPRLRPVEWTRDGVSTPTGHVH